MHLSLASRSEAVGIALFVETSNMKPHADTHRYRKRRINICKNTVIIPVPFSHAGGQCTQKENHSQYIPHTQLHQNSVTKLLPTVQPPILTTAWIVPF